MTQGEKFAAWLSQMREQDPRRAKLVSYALLTIILLVTFAILGYAISRGQYLKLAGLALMAFVCVIHAKAKKRSASDA